MPTSNSRASRLALVATAALVSVSVSARAGVIWKSKLTGSEGASSERTIQISGKMMRIDEPGQATILRLDKGLMWTVDPKAGTYRELTFAEVGAAIDEMKKAIADMPPEQRAMIEKLMGGKATELAPKIEPTGETKTIAGHACAMYTSDLGPVHGTFCAAKDLKPSDELKSFYEALGETIGKTTGLEALRAQADAYRKIDGVPVEEVMVVKIAGQETRKSYTFISYENKDVPASTFEVAATYKKLDSPLPRLGPPAK